jgi:hypothetical protein
MEQTMAKKAIRSNSLTDMVRERNELHSRIRDMQYDLNALDRAILQQALDEKAYDLLQVNWTAVRRGFK